MRSTAERTLLYPSSSLRLRLHPHSAPVSFPRAHTFIPPHPLSNTCPLHREPSAGSLGQAIVASGSLHNTNTLDAFRRLDLAGIANARLAEETAPPRIRDTPRFPSCAPGRPRLAHSHTHTHTHTPTLHLDCRGHHLGQGAVRPELAGWLCARHLCRPEKVRRARAHLRLPPLCSSAFSCSLL